MTIKEYKIWPDSSGEQPNRSGSLIYSSAPVKVKGKLFYKNILIIKGGTNMVYVFIKHKVEDYSRWKPVFDEHGTTRKKAGCKGGQLFHISDETNNIFILFEWDKKENATGFVESEDLKKRMQKAGVIGKPEIYILEKIEDFPV